jgi:hypothetical protein
MEMVLKERRWLQPEPAHVSQTKQEKSIAMSKKRATPRRWIVHHSFEPTRLSPAFLAEAYEKIIPRHIRVIRFETKNAVEQDDGDQSNQTRRAS